MPQLGRRVTEGFWQRRAAGWSAEESQIQIVLDRLEHTPSEGLALNAQRVLELANRTYFLYVTQAPTEVAQGCSSVGTFLLAS